MTRFSAFGQIGNSSSQIGIIDQLKPAFAALASGRGERSVFGISGEGLDGVCRGEFHKRDHGGVQRLALKRPHIAAACQIPATMLVYEFVHRSGVARHPSVVRHLDICDHVNWHVCLLQLVGESEARWLGVARRRKTKAGHPPALDRVSPETVLSCHLRERVMDDADATAIEALIIALPESAGSAIYGLV